MAAPTIQPIEYFLWKHSNEPQDKLIYCDQKGNFFERDVDREELDRAVKIFDGRRKSVRRSTGGSIAVEPYQIVIVTPEGETKPHVRIRVRFKDLKVDANQKVASNEVQSYSKAVTPDELLPAIDYAFNGQQSFALDFGKGVIPIYVFHYESDPDGKVVAHFIEIADLDKALGMPTGEKVEIQAYAVARDVLRLLSDTHYPGKDVSELDEAMENYRRLKAESVQVIPACFKIATPILVPTGGTMQDIRHFLRIIMQRQRGGAGLWEPVYLSIQREDSGELMPFGNVVPDGG